jgi:hypothetical protein
MAGSKMRGVVKRVAAAGSGVGCVAWRSRRSDLNEIVSWHSVEVKRVEAS